MRFARHGISRTDTVNKDICFTQQIARNECQEFNSWKKILHIPKHVECVERSSLTISPLLLTHILWVTNHCIYPYSPNGPCMKCRFNCLNCLFQPSYGSVYPSTDSDPTLWSILDSQPILWWLLTNSTSMLLTQPLCWQADPSANYEMPASLLSTKPLSCDC